jgi:hypothetical protein
VSLASVSLIKQLVARPERPNKPVQLVFAFMGEAGKDER